MSETLTLTQEMLDNRQMSLTVLVADGRVEEAMRQAAKRLASRGRVPGFRPGKAPYHVVLSQFGRDALLEEASEVLLPKVFEEALAESKLEPFAQPVLKDVQTDPMTFNIIVPLPPEVTLNAWQDIRIPWEEPTVTDEQVEEAIEAARQNRAGWSDVTRPAQYGDRVTMNIKGVVGEETLIEQEDFEHILRDAESGFVPGFDAAFVGKAAGDEWTFDLTYPADSASRFKGQTAHFTARLLTVQAQDALELNDEFARSLGDYADLADLRQKVRARLEEQAKAQAQSAYDDKILDKMLELAQVDYPPQLLEATMDDLVEERERRFRAQGASLQAFLELNRITREQYRASLRTPAERQMKLGLIIGQFVKEANIEVTDEEIEAETERRAKDFAGADEARLPQWQELWRSEEMQGRIRNDLLTTKALAHLRASAQSAAPAAAPPTESATPEPPAAETDETTPRQMHLDG